MLLEISETIMYNVSIEEKKISTFEEFFKFVSGNSYKKYCYRGHHHKKYFLKHSLQRALEELDVRDDWWSARENAIIDSFKSKTHLYLSHLPGRDETLEWLSIMQHFGAPTRLLDFTYSPFVALFFAAEQLTTDFSIYEVNLAVLKQLNNSLGIRYDDKQLHLLVKKDKDREKEVSQPLVVPYEPKHQNERLVAQQGLFLFSDQMESSLDKIMNEYNSSSNFIRKYVFDMDKKQVNNIISRLKSMNVDNMRLFPGIEGMSKSMYLSLLEPSSYIR